MTGWSIFFLILLILLLLGYLTWILLTQLRARRSNLPPPTWKSYLFISSGPSTAYGAPTARRGGVVGWVKDKIESVRRGNRRTARGAYEGYEADDGEREVWDSRMGGGGSGGGGVDYYEEQELGIAPPRGGGGGGAGLNVGAHVDEERGRSRSRSRERDSVAAPPPPYETENPFGDGAKDPFGDGAERSELRDVSPRPDGGAQHGDERRSMFRESL